MLGLFEFLRATELPHGEELPNRNCRMLTVDQQPLHEVMAAKSNTDFQSRFAAITNQMPPPLCALRAQRNSQLRNTLPFASIETTDRPTKTQK